jgi:hypothetical protein
VTTRLLSAYLITTFNNEQKKEQSIHFVRKGNSEFGIIIIHLQIHEIERSKTYKILQRR